VRAGIQGRQARENGFNVYLLFDGLSGACDQRR
jgi:hypothetical protein